MKLIQPAAKDLREMMRTVFATWPLYRVLEYTGADEVVTVPPLVFLDCEHCQKFTIWETSFYSNETNDRGFGEKEYKCRNCRIGKIRYYFYWGADGQTKRLLKVGQHPELEETVSASLTSALDAEDLKLYKTALRLRNFDLGIGAVAYMRRIVENRMNDMLDVLYDAAIAHNAPAELLARYEGIKKDKRFSTKVDYAGDLLPSNLRPPGQPNPMVILHELASDALHTKSNEECVDIFDECRQTFEYVFGKMRIETEEARTFIKGMAKLAERRAKAAE